MTAEQPFPEGERFLETVAGAEESCARATLERIGRLGRQAPETNRRLGDLLSILYREAGCAFGCSGGDHLGQRIAGRVVSHALGSYRLLCRGYYDESFALTRNLGEAANLLFLFLWEPNSLTEWRIADEARRRRDFSPIRVRLRLEQLGQPIPIDEARYGGLCEVGVHLTPASTPQAHNPRGVPTLGAVPQDAGFLAALNELAGATGVCGAGLVQLLNCGERGKSIMRTAVDMLHNVGGVDLGRLRGLR